MEIYLKIWKIGVKLEVHLNDEWKDVCVWKGVWFKIERNNYLLLTKIESQIGWDVIYLERESCIDRNKWEEDNTFGHGYLCYIMFGLFAGECCCFLWLLSVMW